MPVALEIRLAGFIVVLGALSCSGKNPIDQRAPRAPPQHTAQASDGDGARADSAEGGGLPIVPWIELPSGYAVGRKLDSGMSASYREWLANPDRSPEAGIAITLHHKGELAPIEARGFKQHSRTANMAFGEVHFRDVPALVDYDGVLWLAAGSRSAKDQR